MEDESCSRGGCPFKIVSMPNLYIDHDLGSEVICVIHGFAKLPSVSFVVWVGDEVKSGGECRNTYLKFRIKPFFI